VGAQWQETRTELRVPWLFNGADDLSFSVLPGERLLVRHPNGLILLSTAADKLALGTAVLATRRACLLQEMHVVQPPVMDFAQMLDDHRMLLVGKFMRLDERPQHISYIRAAVVDADTLLCESVLEFRFEKGKTAQVAHCFYSMGRFWVITRNPSAIECYSIAH
jgi:hypothetical protein